MAIGRIAAVGPRGGLDAAEATEPASAEEGSWCADRWVAPLRAVGMPVTGGVSDRSARRTSEADMPFATAAAPVVEAARRAPPPVAGVVRWWRGAGSSTLPNAGQHTVSRMTLVCRRPLRGVGIVSNVMRRDMTPNSTYDSTGKTGLAPAKSTQNQVAAREINVPTVTPGGASRERQRHRL